MLNIPSEVKTLFQTDGIHKNFHVHFPNEETTDLNNDEIEQESVKFVESLCSQDYFKFGLAEASQIEFTAMGIPNILGATIQCAIEINCTSLGSAWATAHPVDPTLDFLEPQTCMVGSELYYRIPYGEFIVDSCPRDHGMMFRRKIVAYTEEAFDANELVVPGERPVSSVKLSPLDWIEAKQFKLSDMTHQNNYGKVPFQNLGLLGNASGKVVSTLVGAKRFGFTFEVGTYHSYANPYGKYAFQFNFDSHEFDDYGRALTDAAIASFPSGQYIYQRVGGGSGDVYEKTYNSNAEGVCSKLGLLSPCFFLVVFYTNSSSGLTYEYARFSKPVFIKPKERFIIDLENFDGFTFFRDVPSGYTPKGQAELRVFVPCEWSNSAYWSYDASQTAPISSWATSAPFRGRETVERTGSLDIYYKLIENTTSFPNVSIKSTLEYNKGNGLGNYYTYSNAVSMKGFMSGAMEILGAFLKTTRTGGSQVFNISENQTPASIPNSLRAEFWWDENDVEPIGKVNVKRKESDDSDEQMESYSIGSGKSVYSMDDNEILLNTDASSSEVKATIQTYFAPNASVVNFTPVDLTMKGLPYLETGDSIELTADDGETVESYILEQVISGIQNLMAEATSTNGELLEVTEDE